VGTQGYLRERTVEDLSAACRADEACVGRASALAQLRLDRTMLGDGTHPTEAGAVCEPPNDMVIRYGSF